jgi:hypothetical protein
MNNKVVDSNATGKGLHVTRVSRIKLPHLSQDSTTLFKGEDSNIK